MPRFFLDTLSDNEENWLTITDLDGKIVFVNDRFCEITGYSKDEVLGKTHSILRHPETSDSIFKELWTTLEKKDKWSGCLKNVRKDKTEYTVFVEIKAIYRDNKKIGYKSKRTLLD